MANPNKSVLVVEDERDVADLLTYNLRKAGYNAAAVYDGSQAMSSLTQDPPDLVILDLMLPGMTGIEIAQQLRASPKTDKLPILMLTARADEADQLQGLAVGADDYMTKPFSTKLLLARVAALLRRQPQPEAEKTSLRMAAIHADLEAHIVSVDGADAKLTLTEYKLLVAMMQQPRKVLSRTDLINRVMGPGIIVTARTIDVHVAALRKKLGNAGALIRTIRGVGYQIAEENALSAAQDNPDGVSFEAAEQEA